MRKKEIKRSSRPESLSPLRKHSSSERNDKEDHSSREKDKVSFSEQLKKTMEDQAKLPLEVGRGKGKDKIDKKEQRRVKLSVLVPSKLLKDPMYIRGMEKQNNVEISIKTEVLFHSM